MVRQGPRSLQSKAGQGLQTHQNIHGSKEARPPSASLGSHPGLCSWQRQSNGGKGNHVLGRLPGFPVESTGKHCQDRKLSKVLLYMSEGCQRQFPATRAETTRLVGTWAEKTKTASSSSRIRSFFSTCMKNTDSTCQ